ncbi:MAG: TIR domain-containing protein [Opitutus sp.]
MSDASKAVFLSYASQDAEPAKRIADALRAAGVEVWFDQNELVGGDAWDAKIRKQIAECVLFIPVISAATQARLEGYFRIEWKLAAQRTYAMAEEKAFLLPIVIDSTRDAEAHVPTEFKAVQWTRLPGGETGEKFCARVKRLRDGEIATGGAEPGPASARPVTSKPATSRAWLVPTALALGLAVAALAWVRPWEKSGHTRPDSEPAPEKKEPAPFSPARQLAERANALSLQKYNSTADDFAAAEGLLKQALALDQNDAEIWAISSLFNTAIRTRGFDATPARREAARSQAERALKLDPNSTEGLYALGRWQRDNEPDPAVAEKTFLAVLARVPNHDQALSTLATLYDRADRFEESIAMFERAARNPRALPLARYGLYLAYFNRWDFGQAERCLRESIAAEPSANSVAGLALVLLTGKGDAHAAVLALADMPVANRSEHRAVWMSAFAHLAARDPEGALTTLSRLSADFVQDNWFVGPTAYWIGRAHVQAGRTEAARIAFESGLVVMEAKLKAAPGDTALHVARGELLAWLGRTEEALREARTAMELAAGRDLRLWFVSSVRIYAVLGRADDALPLLEKFCARGFNQVGWPLTAALLKIDPLWDKLRSDPRFQALCVEPEAQTSEQGGPKKITAAPLSEGAQLAAKAMALYTKVGFTRDDLAPAEDFARRATDKEPDNAGAWGVRAGVQAAWLMRGWDGSEKRLQETQQLANRALALDPQEPEAILALGQGLRLQGAYEQAIAQLRRGVAAHPDHIRLARALGYTMSTNGHDAEARVVLLEVAKRAPRDPLLHYEIALAYSSYGQGGGQPENLSRALEHLDAAIAIRPFASALVLKAALIGGWRGDWVGMRGVLDQVAKLPLAERSEDRAVCVAMWAGLMEHRPDLVEAAAALTARNYVDDWVMPMRPKAWALAWAHRMAGKENLARADWQSAEAVLRQRLKDDPSNIQYQAELAVTLAWLDQREEAARLMAEVEPLWKEAPTIQTPRAMAFYYAAIGDAVKAAPYLIAVIDRSPFTARGTFSVAPWWEKLRGQPEFEALLKPLPVVEK